ncbi:MAG: serine--tRNA ligase [Candidatus Diapherotrites archaeon]|nr:serine--tRNA ligase [Candidatus Diapherotrites archaeon]
MRREPYAGVTDLADFEQVMYKVDGAELYLIATSEHPLVAMHAGEAIALRELPLKYVGLSACFRKETGKHGLDERGLFRVHQFTKVEQVAFAHPQDSSRLLEEIVENAKGLLSDLEIPFRVVNVCTGDIGIVASKKYDVEGFSPRENKFIELMSCSNCSSYQAVRSQIRFLEPNGEREYLHTLNGTMAATSRMMRMILEHYQTPEGFLRVPSVLQPLMGGLTEIQSPPSRK